MIGSRPSWELVGAGCSNQLSSKKARSSEGLCPCASFNWLLHPAPTSAQDGLDIQHLRWWCFSCHQIVQRSHLHLLWTLGVRNLIDYGD